MQLTTIHKITIGASILLGVLYGAWSAHQFFSHGKTGNALIAVLSIGVSVLLTRYLQRFNVKMATNHSSPDGDAGETEEL